MVAKKSQPVQIKEPEGPVTYVVEENGVVILETPDIYRALHRSKTLSLAVKVYRRPDNVLIAYRNKLSLTEDEVEMEHYGKLQREEEEPGSLLDDKSAPDVAEAIVEPEPVADKQESKPVVTATVAPQPKVVVEICTAPMRVVVVLATKEVQEKSCSEKTKLDLN